MLVQVALGQTGPDCGGLVPVGSTCLLSYRRKHAFIRSYHRLQTGPTFRPQQAHQLTDVDLMDAPTLHKMTFIPLVPPVCGSFSGLLCATGAAKLMYLCREEVGGSDKTSSRSRGHRNDPQGTRVHAQMELEAWRTFGFTTQPVSKESGTALMATVSPLLAGRGVKLRQIADF